jgi:hypothetical protein
VCYVVCLFGTLYACVALYSLGFGVRGVLLATTPADRRDPSLEPFRYHVVKFVHAYVKRAVLRMLNEPFMVRSPKSQSGHRVVARALANFGPIKSQSKARAAPGSSTPAASLS